MRRFDYASPEVADEALALIGPEARPFAGGTDLLPLMKLDVATPAMLVDVKRSLPSGIEETADGIRFGALTTLAEIERSPVVHEQLPALAEACALAATPQLRNMATLGGNLLQRPRCWYYRSPLFNCWLKGGDECQARDGENQQHAIFDLSPCVAAHPSDPPIALLLFGADVTLRGPSGERTLALDALLQAPTEERRTESTVGEDELIASIRVPAPPAGARSVYLKAMDRKIWAFALVSVAVLLRVENGSIQDPRITLGGVANVPVRATTAERTLAGAAPSEEVYARAAEEALDGAQPLAHNAYKLPLLRGLLTQALRRAVLTD
ncbi:MAG TPA: FAD binding domain-containing protein [Chloroflexota bacterium]|nr:FAD binding domain-containing protein [Chloroflexota bacterium]